MWWEKIGMRKTKLIQKQWDKLTFTSFRRSWAPPFQGRTKTPIRCLCHPTYVEEGYQSNNNYRKSSVTDYYPAGVALADRVLLCYWEEKGRAKKSKVEEVYWDQMREKIKRQCLLTYIYILYYQSIIIKEIICWPASFPTQGSGAAHRVYCFATEKEKEAEQKSKIDDGMFGD